jgi:hypothetical protein
MFEENVVDKNRRNTLQPAVEVIARPSVAEATTLANNTSRPCRYSIEWIHEKVAHPDTGTVPPNSIESNPNENETRSRQDATDTAVQSTLAASPDEPATIAAGVSRAEPMSIDNDNSGLNTDQIRETEDAEEVHENVDAELDQQVDEMLNHIVDLARRPSEWLDSLSPQDYLIKDDQYQRALEAGHRDSDSLLRAAFHKINDDSAKQYNAKLSDDETMKVKLKLLDTASEIGVIEFWKPYGTLAVLYEKLSTMSFEAKAQAFSTLWKDIATKTQYLFYARQNRHFRYRPRKWSFVVLLVITCAAQVDLEGALGELASYEDHFETYNDQIADTLKLLRHHCDAYKEMSTPEITAIWYHLHKRLREVARKGMGNSGTDCEGHEGSEQPHAEGQMAHQAPNEPVASTRSEKRKATGKHSEEAARTKKKKKGNGAAKQILDEIEGGE